MRRAIALALATTLLLTLAATPAVATKKVPTGDLLRAPAMSQEEQSFTASTPFHVRHGFVNESAKLLGRYGFELDVDGVPRAADFEQITVDRLAGASVLWYFNYPTGMTGIHVFTGRWYAPCDDADVPCDGARIGTVLMVFEATSTVIFE